MNKNSFVIGTMLVYVNTMLSLSLSLGGLFKLENTG